MGRAGLATMCCSVFKKLWWNPLADAECSRMHYINDINPDPHTQDYKTPGLHARWQTQMWLKVLVHATFRFRTGKINSWDRMV